MSKKKILSRYFYWCQENWDDMTHIECVKFVGKEEFWISKIEYSSILQEGNCPENLEHTSTCSKPIRTLRAFRRYLKKHKEVSGKTMLLVNKYHKDKDKEYYNKKVKVR